MGAAAVDGQNLVVFRVLLSDCMHRFINCTAVQELSILSPARLRHGGQSSVTFLTLLPEWTLDIYLAFSPALDQRGEKGS
jgi:hypothetical protein